MACQESFPPGSGRHRSMSLWRGCHGLLNPSLKFIKEYHELRPQRRNNGWTPAREGPGREPVTDSGNRQPASTLVAIPATELLPSAAQNGRISSRKGDARFSALPAREAHVRGRTPDREAAPYRSPVREAGDGGGTPRRRAGAGTHPRPAPGGGEGRAGGRVPVLPPRSLVAPPVHGPAPAVRDLPLSLPRAETDDGRGPGSRRSSSARPCGPNSRPSRRRSRIISTTSPRASSPRRSRETRGRRRNAERRPAPYVPSARPRRTEQQSPQVTPKGAKS